MTWYRLEFKAQRAKMNHARKQTNKNKRNYTTGSWRIHVQNHRDSYQHVCTRNVTFLSPADNYLMVGWSQSSFTWTWECFHLFLCDSCLSPRELSILTTKEADDVTYRWIHETERKLKAGQSKPGDVFGVKSDQSSGAVWKSRRPSLISLMVPVGVRWAGLA